MNLMKKLSLYIFLILMFCNVGFAEEFKRLLPGYKKLDYNFKCLPGMQIFESNPNWEKSTNFGFLKVKNPFITSDEKYVLLHATWSKTDNEYNFPNSVITETYLKDAKLSKLFEWYEQVGRGPVSATEESSTLWQNILYKSKKKPYKYILQTKIVKIPDEDYKTINDGMDESLNDWMNENPSELNDDAFVESLWFIGKLQSGFYKRYSNDMVAKVTLSCKSF